MDHASHKRTSANESKTCMAKEEAISCQAAKIFSCQLLISATSKKKQIPASLTVVKRKKEDYTWGLWYTWLLALVSVKRGLHLATLCHTYLTESARVAAVMRLSPQSATWAQPRPAWRGSLPGWRWRHSGPVQGGPSALGKRYVDSKFEVAFCCKFILWLGWWRILHLMSTYRVFHPKCK